MRTPKTTLLLMAFTVIMISTSCTKDESTSPKGAFSNGIFIVNEGVFQTGAGTVTYFNPDSNLVKQDIFEVVNGRPLGNIAQSMTIYNGKGYIVMNNSGKVEVVDIATFKSEATILNLTNPSQLLVIDAGKAYVSDWIGHISVVDLATNTVSKTIPAGTGPDAMIKSGNYVYVANQGGFGVDSTLTVIDFTTDKVIKTILIGDVPTAMVADGNGRIWVLCKGKGFNGWPQKSDTRARLVQIDPITLTASIKYSFSSTDIHPEKLVINKQRSMLYFLYNYGVYRFNITLANASPEKINSRSFYSLDYENKTGYLYVSDPKNYVSDGIVIRLKADDGSVVDSIQAGITPRGFAFPE
jgi:YVTN family beta-propeller protein